MTDVINEIQLDKGTTVADYAHDTWITTQLKSKLAFDKNILAINYAIETVNRTVYLIGIAQDQSELARVIAHANSISRVINVVNHVTLRKKAFMILSRYYTFFKKRGETFRSPPLYQGSHLRGIAMSYTA